MASSTPLVDSLEVELERIMDDETNAEDPPAPSEPEDPSSSQPPPNKRLRGPDLYQTQWQAYFSKQLISMHHW